MLSTISFAPALSYVHMLAKTKQQEILRQGGGLLWRAKLGNLAGEMETPMVINMRDSWAIVEV
eukprot:scaffold141_cov232-Pinguiococcus_pyrenoidosus.AAC.9